MLSLPYAVGCRGHGLVIEWETDEGMVRVIKRSLRESTFKSEEWLKRSHIERLEAVEKINRLSERSYVEQAFPRVHRVIRPTSS